MEGCDARGLTKGPDQGQTAAREMKEGESIEQLIRNAFGLIFQVYRNWFRNHGGRKQDQKPPINMGRRWTYHWVIDTLRKWELLNKIQDDTGVKLGSMEMIQHYSKYLSALIESLTEEEIQEAAKMAEEWKSQSVPPKVQIDIAKKKSESMVHHFASEMYKQAGMRVFVLAATSGNQPGIDMTR
ncbi:hypothetical protein EV424DRAFT_1537933 [Suillus variegatus]|nr:hypothetical protein EV424DRAFT_1537933 [Suillus variegatus]